MPPKKIPVRLMLPFSIQCLNCSNYIYKNTKFNARKSKNEESSDLPIWDYEFRCSMCSFSIVLKTNPSEGSNAYTISSGAQLNANKISLEEDYEEHDYEDSSLNEIDIKQRALNGQFFFGGVKKTLPDLRPFTPEFN